ncbi:coproporphyrinogen III oxidase, partial [Alphaproteobacteria bacterium]|nr:coproporphyrinogen III oxidase [Alphaproteobacteria bacterium]
MTDMNDKKTKATAWFKNLRDQLCASFEAIEDESMQLSLSNKPADEPGRFERKSWERPGGGGG